MPQTPSARALNVFAFDANTGQYLGSKTVSGYESARQTLTVGDDLYIAATISFSGGAVLRWRGDRKNPFRFELVAHLPIAAGNLAFHETGFLSTLGGQFYSPLNKRRQSLVQWLFT